MPFNMSVFTGKPRVYKLGVILLIIGTFIYIIAFSAPNWVRNDTEVRYPHEGGHAGLWQCCVYDRREPASCYSVHPAMLSDLSPRLYKSIIAIWALQCIGLAGLILATWNQVQTNFFDAGCPCRYFTEVTTSVGSLAGFTGAMMFVYEMENVVPADFRAMISYSWCPFLDILGSVSCAVGTFLTFRLRGYSATAEEEASSTTKPSDTAVIAGAAVAGAAVVGLSASSSLLFWKKRKRQRLLAEQEKHRNEGGSFRPLHEPEEEETYVDIEDVADEPAVGEEYGYSEIDDGTGRGRRHKPPLPQRDAQRTGIEDPYDQAISSSEDVRPGTSRGSKKTTKKVSLNLHGTEIPYGVCKDTEQQQSSSETSSEDSPASSSPSSKGNESESYTYPGSQHGKKEDYLTPAPSSPGAEQTGSRSLATAAVRNADDYLTPTSADSKGRTQVVTAEVTRADDYLTPTSDTGGGAMTVAADGVRRADDYLTPTSNTSTEGRQAVTTPDYYLTPISGDTVEGSLANDYFTPATEKSGEGSTTPGVADDKQAHIYTPLLPQPQFVLSEEMKKAGYLTPVHIPTTPDTQETDSTISDRKKAGYLTPVEVPGSPELGSKSQERSAPSQDIKKPQDYLTPVSSSSSSSVAAPAKKKKEKSSMIPLAEFWSSKRLSSQRKSPPSSEGETEATHTYEKMGNVKYTEPGNDPAYTKIGEVPVTVSTDPDSYQNC